MKRPTPCYTLLNHTADLGIRICGTDLRNLFENAGMALMHLMLRCDSRIKTSCQKITVTGTDLADLLVRWLGEILYLLEGEHLVVTSLRVLAITSSRLEATLETVPFDPEVHEILSEIKAVTYHQIEVIDRHDRWEASVIFDI